MREVAHEYAKFSLTYEFKRFESLDSKATKFLSFVSIMFGLLITVVSSFFKDFFPPESPMQCVIVFMLFLLSACLVSSWFYLVRAIKVTDVPALRLTKEATLFLTRSDEGLDSDIIEIYAEIIELHRIAMRKKEKLIEAAYRYIYRAGVTFLPTLFLILITKLS
ncbi:hypothetical protein [Vibrio harveyi]|uniref:hypothetical protein n=1 Tax=Vibrio harveyi TaxID=669 RepID=UPI0024B6D1B2|nr:hypothetical protein [Vibrio harveyi]WHP65171.1 hypothetical protein QMY49_24285 [Vibrio harveyi]HDM8132073.1 hypothetical protein [Vibrio harveyi]